MWNLSDDFNAADVDAQIVTPTFVDPFSPVQGFGQRECKRTRLIVDSHGNDVGHATDRYSLVRNTDLRHATELIAERHGFNLSPNKSQYRNGRTAMVWTDVNRVIKVSGDSSTVSPWIIAENSYRCDAPVKVALLLCRYVCQNLLRWGVQEEIEVSKKHVGEINLVELLDTPMQALSDKVAVAELEMNLLQAAELPSNHPVWLDVKEITAERYQPKLGRAVRENAHTLGWTVYGGMQAVSEIGSNVVRGWAGSSYTDKALDLLLQTDEAQRALESVG